MATRQVPGCRIRRVPRYVRREHWRISARNRAAPARPDNPNRRVLRRETRFDERGSVFLSIAEPLRPEPTTRPADRPLARRTGVDVFRVPAIYARPKSIPRKGMAPRRLDRKASATR